MPRPAARLVLVLSTVLLVGCDHATKFAAERVLAGRGVVGLLPGIIDLQYAQNRDTAFSLLRDVDWPGKTLLLGALSLVLVAVLATYLWRRSRGASLVEALGISMVLAGALGNLIDRLARGYVIDFIHLHHWPVFNIADSLLVAGALVLVFFHRRDDRSAPPARS
jgi:signal peptidase II